MAGMSLGRVIWRNVASGPEPIDFVARALQRLAPMMIAWIVWIAGLTSSGAGARQCSSGLSCALPR